MSARTVVAPVERARTASPVRTIARWEFRNSVRARWVLVMAGIFGLLCVVVTLLAFRTVRELGLAGIGPASATLVNLGVLLPSLMGLLLGAGSVVGAHEQGLLPMMAAQPLRRSAIVTGMFVGLTASLWTTLAVGFGAALLVMSGVARASDVGAIVTLLAATFGVAMASVAIGVALSTLARTRAQAVAGAVGLWIMLALGVDLALAALAPSVHMGPRGLLAAILLNPLEASRILALLGTDLRGAALGPFGAYLITTFGVTGTLAILVADLIVWTAVPLVIARRWLPRRDL
jgi:ABC-type transport system involved in multi-copper enzyme maturation permease subunit